MVYVPFSAVAHAQCCQYAQHSHTCLALPCAVLLCPDSTDNVNRYILALISVQGLLIPFFLKLQLPILDGWFLAALNCFAGGVFLTFGKNALTQDLSNFLALPWATCRSSVLCTLLLFLLGCAPVVSTSLPSVPVCLTQRCVVQATQLVQTAHLLIGMYLWEATRLTQLSTITAFHAMLCWLQALCISFQTLCQQPQTA